MESSLTVSSLLGKMYISFFYSFKSNLKEFKSDIKVFFYSNLMVVDCNLFMIIEWKTPFKNIIPLDLL